MHAAAVIMRTVMEQDLVVRANMPVYYLVTMHELACFELVVVTGLCMTTMMRQVAASV